MSALWRIAVIGAALAVAIATSPRLAAAQDGISDAARGSESGVQLYAVHCASCHGAQRQGTTKGPPLVKVDAGTVDFWLSTGRMPASVPWIEQARAHPQLTRDEINALASYVASTSGGSLLLPAVDASGDLPHGRRLYAANCMACHGAAAQGGATGFGWIAPSLDRASVEEVAEAIRAGPGIMPRFDRATLSDRDVDDIVTYVHWLAAAHVHPGGIALLGPVGEGFVAWVALAALVGVVALLSSGAARRP